LEPFDTRLSRGLLLFLVCFACNAKKAPPPTVEQSIAEWGPKVEARLKNVDAIGRALPNIKVTQTIKLDGPPLVFGSSHPPRKGNAAELTVVDFDDLTRMKNVPWRFNNRDLSECAAILRKRALAFEEARPGDEIPLEAWHAAQYLPTCAGLRYLVVVRTSELSRAAALSTKSFLAGSAKGEILVFNLETGAYLGGVPFEARSSTSVEVAYRDVAREAVAAHDAVDSDFARRVSLTIREALQAALPDAKVD
jgi:hypothetical protein